eukprot:COSAG06_NODE_37044_length_440_cov_0.521994_2_plen_42_part_01
MIKNGFITTLTFDLGAPDSRLYQPDGDGRCALQKTPLVSTFP